MPTGSTATTIATVKVAWYFGAIALFEYLNIPQEQLTILSVLMAIDFATGLGKQWRIDAKKITSHKATLGALKKVATLVSVLSIGLIFKGIGLDGGNYITMVLGVFIMAEGYSVLQNVYAIRTGKVLPEYDVISLLIKSLGEYLKFRMEKTLKIATKDPFTTPEALKTGDNPPTE